MSQEQPQQPEPQKTQPTTPAPERDQSKSALQQINQTLQRAWSQAQPVLRSQSIKLLRATIQALEGLLAKLETPPKTTAIEEPPKSVQPSATIELSESQAAPPSGKLPDQSIPAASPESILNKLRPRLEQLQGWWNVALGKIRSWLPESVNQKLSDTGLTGAIAGILVILLWTTSSLLPGKPPKVANVPPSQPNLPATDLTAPPELSAPEKPQPVEVNPPLEPLATPPPTPELSPEQRLIAEIQTQVTKIGNQYADRLVQSVQANLLGSRLLVKASDDWYKLSPSQQDKLAEELLNRIQELNLSKLEITDSQGTLLARSPVVGGNVVVVKRQILR